METLWSLNNPHDRTYVVICVRAVRASVDNPVDIDQLLLSVQDGQTCVSVVEVSMRYLTLNFVRQCILSFVAYAKRVCNVYKVRYSF